MAKSQKDKYAKSVKEMDLLEKVFLLAVGIVGFVNLGFIGTIAKSLYMKETIAAEFFNGVLLALILQAILVNTIFVWKISDRLEAK
ncbi:MAG: hypothetical protein V1820_06525 [archaeon]